MATNNQFSIAVHIMAVLGYQPGVPITSNKLATSVNTNHSFLRRILSLLAKAGLIHTTKGKTGACTLVHEPQKISLLDIYRAIEPPKAIAVHNYPEQTTCVISCKFKDALTHVLAPSQLAMENTLKKSTLADIIADIKNH